MILSLWSKSWLIIKKLVPPCIFTIVVAVAVLGTLSWLFWQMRLCRDCVMSFWTNDQRSNCRVITGEWADNCLLPTTQYADCLKVNWSFLYNIPEPKRYEYQEAFILFGKQRLLNYIFSKINRKENQVFMEIKTPLFFFIWFELI